MGRICRAGVASAADELEDLGHELDFADAAGAELDVIGHVLARHFATDLGMQVAHGVDGAEIEVLAEDEGAGDALQGVDPAGLCLATAFAPLFMTRALIQA